MTTYYAVVTYKEAMQVNADSEEQAIEQIKAGLPPRTVADIQIAQEANIAEEK